MKTLELRKLSKKKKKKKRKMKELVWGEFEAKKCFQRKPFRKYLRLTQLSL